VSGAATGAPRDDEYLLTPVMMMLVWTGIRSNELIDLKWSVSPTLLAEQRPDLTTRPLPRARVRVIPNDKLAALLRHPRKGERL
jgi:integrase